VTCLSASSSIARLCSCISLLFLLLAAAGQATLEEALESPRELTETQAELKLKALQVLFVCRSESSSSSSSSSEEEEEEEEAFNQRS